MIGLVDGNNFYVSCERVFDRRLVGRPVAVLSNNDGCCVAMSPEFKALGIPRGTPYFQLREREKTDGLVFRSSNYELYGDMSRRIIAILREEAVEVEQYSIDEAFIHPPTCVDYADYGKQLREKILRWTGIPCGVGFAPTKTLAKIANHAAKRCRDGIFVMPGDTSGILAELPADEVWGVGHRLSMKLRLAGIRSARDLRDAPNDVVRGVGGVTLERTAMELRGIPCAEERDYEADPDSVSCSRSFGEYVSDLESLSESIASFIAQAAVKLRRHRMLAGGCNIYVQKSDLGFSGRTVVFPESTDATNEMLAAVREAIPAVWLPGERYRKSGVVFFGLERVGAAKQADLFETVKTGEASGLYRAIDALNAKYGRGRVFSAAEGIERRWKMKRTMLSRRATTCWEEIPVAR